MAFYELRQYHVRPGKMDEWVRIMEEEIIPFQVSKGMVICGSYRGETDESAYVWIRRFEQRGRARRPVQGGLRDRALEDQDRPRVPECLDRDKMVITRLGRNAAVAGAVRRSFCMCLHFVIPGLGRSPRTRNP